MRPVTFRFESNTYDRNPHLIVLHPARRRRPRRPPTHPRRAALGRGEAVFERNALPNEEIASVFVDAILAAGGLPLQMSITEDIEVIRHYVDIADGIAIPGGPDVNPKRWAMIDPTTPPSAARFAIALSLSWSARCSVPKSRSLPPAAARSCSMSPLAAPVHGRTEPGRSRGPHAVAPYPRAQRPCTSRRGRAGLASGARGWRAQTYPDQLRTPLLRRPSG